MHDLVHDLATIILGHESVVLNATEPRSRKKAKHHYCRHAQLINYQNQYEVFNDLPGNIRSFHIRHSEKQQLPQKAFSRTKYIRVLDLSGCLLVGQSTPINILLPSSVLQLKLLRYLDASSLPITSLPESFHSLQNMETLILSNCSLETLPDSICSLNRLGYLDLAGNARINKLPSNFHLLTKLIFLNMSSCSKLTKLPGNFSLEYLEHLNLSGCHELKNLPQDFHNLQNLRFLNLSDCYKISVLPESFCQLTHLKDLNLSDCRALIVLPEGFGNLSELKSLNLTSCPRLAQLPESICKMTNLKCLNLSYCLGMPELPSSLGDLDLQILDISAGALRHLPDSISKMTSLTQLVVTSGHPRVFREAQEIKKHLNLPRRIVHRVLKGIGYNSIVELEHVNCQELLIRSLHCVKKQEDAERVKLRDKSCVRQLALHWKHQNMNASRKKKKRNKNADECSAKSILEKLIPSRNLEQFMIQGYTSKGFPRWMSYISSHLPSVTYLSLSDLGACDNLPPFGQLPNLRSLYLQKIPNVTKIGKEFYGEGGTCTKLRLLQLKSMDNLAAWFTTRSGEEDGEFLIPNLHNLEVKDCPLLEFLPYPPRSMFWCLDNSDEVLAGQGFGKLSSSTLPCRMGIKNCSFRPGKWSRLEQFPTLEEFSLSSSHGLRALPEVIRCFTSLKKLSLMSLEDLETVPYWLGHLTSLQVLGIKDCCSLMVLPESMKNLTALRVLMLLGCKGLDTLPEWLGQLSSLRELRVRDCPNITSLPRSIRNLTALEELYISGCPSLVHRSRRKDAYKVSHSPKVILEREEPNEEQGQEESQEAWIDRLSKKYEIPSRHREDQEELESQMSDSDSEHLSRYGQENSESEDDEQEDWYL